LIIAGVVLLIASCKNVPEEIIGTWNFQTFDTQPQGVVTWTFKEDGQLIRIMTNNDGIHFDTCNYVIDKSMFKSQITISGSDPLTGYTSLDGIYRIDKFKDDILIMTRERLSDDEVNGAYLRCEMQRKL